MASQWSVAALLGLGLGGIVAAARLPAPDPHPSPYFDAPRPMVIAHQGGDGIRPSNTMAAFEHAAALGVDVLEMDVHMTRDGALVLIHDDTVDRTTNGSGAVADLTLAEIQALDAAYHWPYGGSGRPFRGRGLTVPTLAEVAERFPEFRLLVEIKTPSAAAGVAVCDNVRRLGLEGRILIASFHPATMDAFRAACPEVPTSAVESEVRRFYTLYRTGLWRFARPRPAALQVPPQSGGIDLSDAGFLAAARARGLHVDFWTIDDPGQMRALIDAGAAGLITDRPDLMLDVVGRGGGRLPGGR